MIIKNLFKKKYAKGGVIPKEVLDSIEHDRTCDDCERLEECKEKGGVQEIGNLPDGRKHYFAGHKCLKNPYVMAEIAYRECKKAHDRSFNDAGEYIGDYKSYEEEAKVMKEFTDSFYKLMKELGRFFDGE